MIADCWTDDVSLGRFLLPFTSDNCIIITSSQVSANLAKAFIDCDGETENREISEELEVF